MPDGGALIHGIRLRGVRDSDLESIMLQNQQMYMRLLIDDKYKEVVRESDIAFTLEKNGVILGCGGIVRFWGSAGEAWTLLSRHAAANMLTVTKVVKRILADAPFDRVQMTTDVGFEEAERWARMLGFEYEGTMRKYGHDGRDMKLWARVR